MGNDMHGGCPQCGAELPSDDRFVVWCVGCAWNVRGGADEAGEDAGRVDRFRRRLSRAYGEELFGRMTSAQPPRPGRGTTYAAAHALAGVVHLLTLAVAASGLWLVVTGWDVVFLGVLGIMLLALAWLMRPRLHALPRDGVRVYRGDAPALYGLLDEVAGALGAPRADVVVVDADVNASVQVMGLRRRIVLRIGLGLWEPLTPQQRIALLGHEFGHLVNGDTRQGLFVGSALGTLAQWYALLRPTDDTRGMGLIATVARLTMFPPAYAALLLLRLLEHLTLRASQQAEYLADDLAARIGSSAAAMDVVDFLLLADTATFWLHRQGVSARTVHRGRTVGRQPAETVWEQLREYTDSIPPHEVERRRRLSVLTAHAENSTHPPTHLRRAALAVREQRQAGVVTDVAREKEIDAGLDPARRELGRKVLNG
ncbi:M48 family metallopeptidase [Streptomyces sp. MI02-7b]|uniref:M48 family metallopeptidase n=1 Tax=Streptomyces sp. MI02-7b TaxID=462941 RepID=UPI0029BBD62C|nr:M48 family metallopeptidase [Streptomyces sp. MI02-7b]MDX3076888.1 M48 family metallopeptidase [Streptomyces sp. MI02-7b]